MPSSPSLRASRTAGLFVVPAVALAALVLGCAPAGDSDPEVPPDHTAHEVSMSTVDPHSSARPDQVTGEHLVLDLEVDFDSRRLTGSATWLLDRKDRTADRVIFDTRDLEIRGVTDGDGKALTYQLADPDPLTGAALTIDLEPMTREVVIDYATSPDAAAVQWLEPAQTSGDDPFLFTQSQAILARTWIPIQDSPGVRFTYEATIEVPRGLMAVMSADGNPREIRPDGTYSFSMPQPVPSYLMALAVGKLSFRSLGERSGVYAEPQVIEAAALEFSDTPDMIRAAETLYGPYQWGRYDLLVLPPSFPFGGMENPRLTFLTPTVIAGDRSLVALIAHELAHSWSGNLVTNATWNDFWLNEGFTTYFERRIMEAIRGEGYADMLAVLGRRDLDDSLEELGPQSADTHLRLDLAGRDPDDGMTNIAYEKGALFLRTVEEAVGRNAFDAFLESYFDRYAFRTMDTDSFLTILEEELLAPKDLTLEDLHVAAWVDGPGVPANAVTVEAEALEQVDTAAQRFANGVDAGALMTEGWNTHQWRHFLNQLPDRLPQERMAQLDVAFDLSESRNSEILAAWLQMAIRSGYEPADPALERFLTTQGRRKFLKPLYEALAETPEGTERAREIYAQARPGYHSVSTGTIDELLDWEESAEAEEGDDAGDEEGAS